MTRTYRSIIAVTRVLVRIFFRQVEVTGEENVPETGGGIVVAAHPNGLVDPILILTYFPRPIVFGARHGLFRWPLLGWIMRQIGTVPLYRAVDTSGAQGKKARRAGNKKALDAQPEPRDPELQGAVEQRLGQPGVDALRRLGA